MPFNGHNHRSVLRLSLMFILTLLSIAGHTEDKLTVYTVNYPLKYFAERIGGTQVKVTFPVPANEDPAFWNPSAETVLAFQQADLILLNGAGYAKWLNKASLPFSPQVDTSSAFRTKYLSMKETMVHAHGSGGKHSHTGTAFTTWLDTRLAILQANDIMQAFVRKRPALKQIFQTNYQRLEKDLQVLDQSLVHLTAAESPLLLGSHPVYQYLAQGYGLNMKSVHWEPDQIPSEEQWAKLLLILKQHPAKWMLWEAEPLPAVVAKLKAVGVSSLVFNPCGNVPEQGDYLSVMSKNIENLKQAF